MLFIIGLTVAAISVVVGYLTHHGELMLLYQPGEWLIIIGGALGGAIIANTYDNLVAIIRSLKDLFKTRPKSKNDYLDLMNFFFNTFKLMKVKGMLEIETHIENPHESELFNQAPSILDDKHVLDFIRDYLRIMTMGVDNVHQFEDLIEKELEVLEENNEIPGKAILTIGDSLPALGIVAAVLGVIVTMRSISEPPEILGSLIAAALVGTFTGVLLAYAAVLPMGHYIKSFASEKMKFYKAIKTGFISHLNGNAPIITAEFMRKTIPNDVRPDFYEADKYINSKAKIN